VHTRQIARTAKLVVFETNVAQGTTFFIRLPISGKAVNP
jgi:hypothetical protein